MPTALACTPHCQPMHPLPATHPSYALTLSPFTRLTAASYYKTENKTLLFRDFTSKIMFNKTGPYKKAYIAVLQRLRRPVDYSLPFQQLTSDLAFKIGLSWIAVARGFRQRQSTLRLSQLAGMGRF